MTVDEIELQLSSKVVTKVGQACRDGHHSGDGAQMKPHRALGQWLHLPSNVNGHGPRDNRLKILNIVSRESLAYKTYFLGIWRPWIPV
jgi:hypothetical protein